MQRVLSALLAAVAVVVLPHVVRAEEVKKPGRPSPQTLFERLDKNKDGQIVADEVPPGAPERLKGMLRRADKNDDKKLTLAELTEAIKDRKPGPPRSGPDARPRPPGPPRGGPHAKPYMPGPPPGGPHARPDRPGPPHDRMARCFGPGHPHQRRDFARRHDWPGRPRAGHRGPRLPDPKVVFMRLDTNKDKVLSLEEFAVGMRRLHQRRRPAMHPPLRGPGRPGAEQVSGVGRLAMRARAMFRKADADHDGKVTPAEVPSERRERFKRFLARADRDGDQALSVAEARRAVAAIARRMAGHGWNSEPQARRRIPRLAKVIKRLKAADKNQDGKLSKAEAPGPLKRHFAKIDGNKDGQLDRPELKRAVAVMIKKRAAQEAQPKKAKAKKEKAKKAKAKRAKAKAAKAKAKAKKAEGKKRPAKEAAAKE